MLKTRDRLVNFRVTQDELDYLKVACAAKGARSVSDFARSAVLRSASDGNDPLSLLENHVSAIEQKLLQMQETLQQIAQLFPAVSVPFGPDAGLRELDRALRLTEPERAGHTGEVEFQEMHGQNGRL